MFLAVGLVRFRAYRLSVTGLAATSNQRNTEEDQEELPRLLESRVHFQRLDFSDVISMAAVRPPADPSFPDRMVNPVSLPSSCEYLLC